MQRVVAVHSIPSWLPQTQNWMYTQVQNLPEDIETHIVCEHLENEAQFQMPHIHCLKDEPTWRSMLDRGVRKLGIRQHLKYLPRTARRLDARILHSHFGHFGWAEINAARRANLKHVVTFYGLDVNFLPRQDPRWLTRYQDLFKHINLVCCEGAHMGRCLVDLGCPEEKVHIQHLGIRLGEIPFNPRTWQPDKPLRVLMAASFREKKGLPYALEALSHIQHHVDLEITLIGDADSAPRSQQEKKLILDKIEKHQFKKIRMLGYQPYNVLFEEAARHHLFLSPSVTAADGDTEGGAPVSLIEMQASGLMVVSTTHCDIPEVVRHGETGLLAAERDVEGLVAHLQKLIAAPDEWLPMLKAARAHVEAEYNASIQGQRLGATYQALLAN